MNHCVISSYSINVYQCPHGQYTEAGVGVGGVLVISFKATSKQHLRNAFLNSEKNGLKNDKCEPSHHRDHRYRSREKTFSQCHSEAGRGRRVYLILQILILSHPSFLGAGEGEVPVLFWRFSYFCGSLWVVWVGGREGAGYLPYSGGFPSVCRSFSVPPSDGYTGWRRLGSLGCTTRSWLGLGRPLQHKRHNVNNIINKRHNVNNNNIIQSTRQCKHGYIATQRATPNKWELSPFPIKIRSDKFNCVTFNYRLQLT